MATVGVAESTKEKLIGDGGRVNAYTMMRMVLFYLVVVWLVSLPATLMR